MKQLKDNPAIYLYKMGIPSYFSQIIRKYKGIITPLGGHYKHLFMDCNSIVYDCVHRMENPTDKDVIEAVIAKIKEYITIIKPSNTVYIAFDGVAPFAKMEQQRNRRYKTDFLAKISQGDNQKFNTSKITPGTIFMKQLSLQIAAEFSKPTATPKVLVSAANEIGEGEHKIFQYIREYPTPDDDIIIYGLDSDLFMLSIFHHQYVRNCHVFREAPEFLGTLIDIDPNNQSEFYMVDIALLKTAILANMGFHENRRIYDYAFLCFFLGNDFLPHFPALNIRTHGIQTLLDIYRELFATKPTEFLVDVAGGNIQWKNVAMVIKRLAKLETDFMIEEYNMRKKYATWTWKEPKTAEERDKAIQNFPIMYCAEESYVDPGSVGWEERYYKILFPANPHPCTREQICKNYFEGLEWVYKYYIGRPIDWKWKYHYHYGPLFRDLQSHIPRKELIKKNRAPFFANAQLAYVLPRTQQDLLPDHLRTMIQKKYETTLYPQSNLEFQWAFCRYFWECHVILPHVDIEILDGIE